MDWLEAAFEQKHGRRPTALEMAKDLCELGNLLDHGWRRRDPATRRRRPPLTYASLLAEARGDRLEIPQDHLIPQEQIDVEAAWELEEAILSVSPRTVRERQAVDDLRRLHAVAATRAGKGLAESRRRATSSFGRHFKRPPVAPSAHQLREAERIVKRRRKRERASAQAFRKALGKLPEQDPATQAATVRDWRRLKRRAEERATRERDQQGPPVEAIEEYENRVMQAALDAAHESQAPDTAP